MSASVYAAMEDVIANNTSRISVLEQSALTYDISGLVSADPTNAEISAAFQQKYPNIPIQPGIRVADYNNAHFWQYGNNMWILLTQINIQTATNDSLGTVKGSDTDGKVFVETDGSMSLKGYDALVSKDATHDSKINTLEVGLGNANARIDATNTNVANNAADIVAANGNISTNTNDINGLKGRMATAEGQIATHETKITQHTQSINGLTTDVNALQTSKQSNWHVTNRGIQDIITVDNNYTVHITEDVIIELFYFSGTEQTITLLHIFKGDYTLNLNTYSEGYIYFKGGQYYNDQDTLKIRVRKEDGISYRIEVHGQPMPVDYSVNLADYQYTSETMPSSINNQKGFRIRVRS